MATCPYFQRCEFVLTYVSKVKPHWDDFVTLYCQGSFQDVCKRRIWIMEKGDVPPIDMMPTGQKVPGIL
jgi:hypothetical protein